MKSRMICIVYVDYKILAGTNKHDIEAEIKILGVISDEHRQKLELRDEGEVEDFLGIRIDNTGE